MCANWGYQRLHEAIEKRAIQEMGHAEKLIERILFFDGKPIVSELNPISIGADVEAQHKGDLAAEVGAVKAPNDRYGARGGIGHQFRYGKRADS